MNKFRYEVWALGYAADGAATDIEEFLGEFRAPEVAIRHAKRFKDISYVYDRDVIENDFERDYFLEIRVEKINNEDSSCNTCVEVLYSMNIFMPEK